MTSTDETGGEVKQTREEWLAGLGVGDVVAIGCERFPRKGTIIESRDASVLVDIPHHWPPARIRRSSGEEWAKIGRDKIFPYEEYKDVIDKNEIANYLSRFSWNSPALTADQLRRIEAICKESQP